MKDKYKIILMVVVLTIGFLTMFLKSNEKETKSDAISFKEEYESLNSKTNSQDKQYLSINISDDNVIKYASFEEIKEVLTKKSGVIYFGFPECPWCRNIIEPLFESAKEEGIEKIYYFNAHDIRDKKHLDDDGNIIVDDEGTSEYHELIKIMKDYLTPYEGLENNDIKRLYFPTVVFVKDGKIKDIHIGTIDEQKDPYTPLSGKQKEQLKSIYKKGIEKTISTTCDDKC